MAQRKPKPSERQRSTPVFDTPSGLGGTHTVTVLRRKGDSALVSVCYGTFRGGSQWESWPDWDGAEFWTPADELTNPGILGEPVRDRRNRAAMQEA